MSGTIENQVVPAISEEDEVFIQAMLISTTHIFCWVLKAATDLDLFGIIARAGPAACMTPTEIASQLPTQDSEAPSRLDRMLRLLASHSVLTCSIHTLEDGRVERLYGLTPASQFLFEKEDRGSVACISAFPSHRAIYEVSMRMKDAILEGGNLFKKVHGMPMFQYMDGDPTFKEMFFKIMDDDSTMVMKKILEVYQGFEGLKSLVDVGGGIGKCMNMIISKNPTTKGINFDLPHVIQNAPSYPGIEHVGGDMFHNVPKGDAIMIKYILHDWSDEDCMKLLRNCYEALPNNGKVVIIELLMQEAPDSSMSSQYVSRLDNGMLLYLEGKERTEKEFEALCKGSGFSEFKDAILERGNQFEKVHGMSIFQYMDKDPAFNIVFNKGMTDLSKMALRKILEVYQGFVELSSLVDVGGGTGRCLKYGHFQVPYPGSTVRLSD